MALSTKEGIYAQNEKECCYSLALWETLHWYPVAATRPADLQTRKTGGETGEQTPHIILPPHKRSWRPFPGRM